MIDSASDDTSERMGFDLKEVQEEDCPWRRGQALGKGHGGVRKGGLEYKVFYVERIWPEIGRNSSWNLPEESHICSLLKFTF